MELISWDDFAKVELRVGRILSVEEFAAARTPSYVLQVDFGEEIGVRKSSARITTLYKPDDLIGKSVVAVVNLPKRQIGPLMSECLVTGFQTSDGGVALCVPDREVVPGSRLF
ncbi:MAG: tRNA-binding protein [Ignavibacteria bacterium]|nr:tRNA-binding protein [Ignavibacteria bacterium]